MDHYLSFRKSKGGYLGSGERVEWKDLFDTSTKKQKRQ